MADETPKSMSPSDGGAATADVVAAPPNGHKEGPPKGNSISPGEGEEGLHARDPAVLSPGVGKKIISREGGSNNNNLSRDENGQPNDNLQPQKEGSPEENNPTSQALELGDVEKNLPINSDGGRELTVIDGPLATPEVSLSPRIPSVKTEERSHATSHTPSSSMGSSLGELLGEPVAIMENGAVEGMNACLDIISTDKPGLRPQQEQQKLLQQQKEQKAPVLRSKSAPEVAKTAAGTTTTPAVLEKAVSVSGPAEEKAAMGPVGEKVTPGPKPSSSSPDNVDTVLRRSAPVELRPQTAESDDEDDDEETEIPAHIQSRIVERSPAERYIRFKEKLGSGAYKDVYRAYDSVEGIEVAWNVVRLSGVPKAERVRIVNEVRLLERLHHPNIISFHGSWVNRETERVIFVTEILSSGTLKCFVQKVQLIRWKIFKRWAIQILKGLAYLHEQDPPIIHRDLKCDNIFINGTSGDLRIGDFGLSTAISKKNQPLSVLGTPEFMAPELYDESYNEKVDIYAFGMLLLEIITRDVPYHECTNPAQIYKKVTHGIPPPSLRRVKSEEARNFILLCLGIGQDASARPSASDLLKSEFLTKRLDDEATIEVEPAVEDTTVMEEAARNSITLSETDSSDHSSKGSGKNSETTIANNRKYSSSIDGHEIPPRGSSSPMRGAVSSGSPKEKLGKPPRNDKNVAALSNIKTMDSTDPSNHNVKDDDELPNDHFDEMPENEANMKKVTVLMGRGTTLDDLDERQVPPPKETEVISLSSTPPPTAVAAAVVKPTAMLPRTGSEAETSSLGSKGSMQYKVSAVPKDDGTSYPQNPINLALTLPDEGGTTIEFEFDLVDDDPVQVAKEMITELEEVPDDAVLDISEAISGVARQARMKQNQWTKLQQQQQQQLAQQAALQQQQAQQQQAQQGMMMHPQGSVLQQAQGIQGPQGTILMQPPQQHAIYAGSGFPTSASAGNFQNPHDPSQSVIGGPTSSALQAQSQPNLQQQQQPQQQSQPNLPQQQQSHVAQQLAPAAPPPAPMSTPHPSQMSNPPMSNPHQSQPQHQHQTQHHQVLTAPPPIPQSAQKFPQQPTMVRSNSIDLMASEMNSTQTLAAPRPPTQPVQKQYLPPSITPIPSQDVIAPRQQIAPAPLVTQDASTKVLKSQNTPIISHKQPTQMPLPAQQPPMAIAPEGRPSAEAAITQAGLIEESMSESDPEEIRKLEKEFEKKMLRAKKSYGTRMDNLHRSKEEAEMQRKMTLEKHEKERIEFEKRVRLAEEEQTRRLNQIQKEFMEKKEEVRQQHAKAQPPPQGAAGPGSASSQNEEGSRPPLHGLGGHKRSMSLAESSLQPPQQPPPTTKNQVRQQHAKAQPPPSPGMAGPGPASLQNGESSRPPLHASGGHKRSMSHAESSLQPLQQPPPITMNKSESEVHPEGAPQQILSIDPQQQHNQQQHHQQQHQQQQRPPPAPRSGGLALPSNLPKPVRPAVANSNVNICDRDRSGSVSS